MDSPIFQLMPDMKPQAIESDSGVFRERVHQESRVRERLASARSKRIAAFRAVERDLGQVNEQQPAVVLDVFLSYRAVRAWRDTIDLVAKMRPALAGTVLVQEQYALVLNRDGQTIRRRRCSKLVPRGPSSETLGSLGRMYKDRWVAVSKRGEQYLARGLLERAIDTYSPGFQTDIRDCYPGINAVTLMDVKNQPDPRRDQLVPVVKFALNQRIASGSQGYWEYATQLQLASLERDDVGCAESLVRALEAMPDPFQLESTVNNIRITREPGENRGEDVAALTQVEAALEQALRGLTRYLTLEATAALYRGLGRRRHPDACRQGPHSGHEPSVSRTVHPNVLPRTLGSLVDTAGLGTLLACDDDS